MKAFTLQNCFGASFLGKRVPEFSLINLKIKIIFVCWEWVGFSRAIVRITNNGIRGLKERNMNVKENVRQKMPVA